MASGIVSVELIRWQMKDLWRMKKNVLGFLTAEDRNMAEITGAKPGQELIGAMIRNNENVMKEKPVRTQKPGNMK